MIQSELILPIRFYNSLYEQRRFEKYNIDQEFRTDLFYPQNALPHFQITRDMSLNTVTRFWLKNVCNDAQVGFYKAVPKGADIFSKVNALAFYGPFEGTGAVYDNGVDPPSGVTDAPVIQFDSCGGIKNANDTGQYTSYNTAQPFAEILIPGIEARYTFKIVVDKFLQGTGSLFTIKIYRGDQTGTLLQTINKPGIYLVDVPEAAGETGVAIVFDSYQNDSEFKITYAQLTLVNPLDAAGFINDVELDETKLKVIPLKDGRDVIVYCEDESDYGLIEPGDYYYIVEADEELYFSEVFTIKPMKEIQGFFRLEWFSSCDIQNVLYNFAALNCSYTNVLYLDASLFKPEYPTKNAVLENSDQDETSQFKSWRKVRTLDIVCPEFLTDSLSGIFLHEFIFLTEPLNEEQESGTETSVEKITADIQDVMYDTKQRVLLAMTLSDKFTKSNCCDNTPLVNCNPANFVAGDEGDCGTYDYYLVLTTPPNAFDGLYICTDVTKPIDVSTDQIILYQGKYYQLIKVGNHYEALRIMPKILQVATVGSFYVINAQLFSNVWGTLQYKKNGGSWTNIITKSVGDPGDFSHASLITDFGGGVTDLKFRIRMFSLNCDWGLSDEFDKV